MAPKPGLRLVDGKSNTVGNNSYLKYLLSVQMFHQIIDVNKKAWSDQDIFSGEIMVAI